MSDNKQDKELSIFDLACQQNLSESQRQELNDLLRNSEKARSEYLDYLSMHVDINNRVRVSRVRQKFDDYLVRQETQPQAGKQVEVKPALQSKRLFINQLNIVATLALAATLLLAFFPASFFNSSSSKVALVDSNSIPTSWPNSVAKINRVDGVTWDPGAESFQQADYVTNGEKISFEKGLVEVEFRQGAIVLLEGPAMLVPNGNNHATLIGGKLAAYAPPWASGFRVDTPGIDVVDHGTEFAVNVLWDDGSDPVVNVVVTEGEVEVLHSREQDGRRLKAGDGVTSTGGKVTDGDDYEARRLTDLLPDVEYLKNSRVVADRWEEWVAGMDGEPRREGAWRYYTNMNGKFGDPSSYQELVWDSESSSYRLPQHLIHGEVGRFVRVHRVGGHPGKGRNQMADEIDRYSITAYIVPSDGTYRIESGWLERLWSKRWNLDSVLDVCVHVNDGPILSRHVCHRNSFVAFNGSLGELKAGDVVYIGVGPNGESHGDRFRWGFYIVEE